jgi:hypothetical protein
MTIRRPLAVLLAAGLAFSVAACSDDDGSDEGSSSSTTTTAADAAEQTTTTISDEEFSAKADEVAAAVQAAGTDLCAVGVAPQELPTPGTPAQLERMLQIFKQTLDVAASALEADDAESAEALRTAASDLIAEAEAADYDMSFISGDSMPEALQSPEYLAASEALNTKFAAECQPSAGGGGATGEAPETTAPQG